MSLRSSIAWTVAVLVSAGAFAAEPPRASAPPPKLPPGVSPVLWRLSVPAGAEPTPEKVALGEKLFNDKRLSADDTVSCATCHEPNKGFMDGKDRAVGIKNQKGMRNSPTVLNAMFNASQFWDGRADMLEDQAKLPILNPIEMGMPSPEAVVTKVRGLPEYPAEFQKVFGREVNYDDLAAAIAAFERTQYSGSARFDKFILGDDKALTASRWTRRRRSSSSATRRSTSTTRPGTSGPRTPTRCRRSSSPSSKVTVIHGHTHQLLTQPHRQHLRSTGCCPPRGRGRTRPRACPSSRCR